MDFESIKADARREWDADPRMAYARPDYLTVFQARLIESYRLATPRRSRSNLHAIRNARRKIPSPG